MQLSQEGPVLSATGPSFVFMNLIVRWKGVAACVMFANGGSGLLGTGMRGMVGRAQNAWQRNRTSGGG